ncbi:MAG TPA: MFS transporter [Xanthobacteraceae bacterium]|nr:MFS transporter [Xanthobacteraceae bacterium]
MADRMALRLSFFYGAYFLYGGLSLPFLPAWLGVKGLDAREIGIVLAAPMVVRVLAVPLWSRLADRLGMLPRALVAAAAASVAAFALVGVLSGFAAILIGFAVAATVSAPVLPFGDALALRALRGRMPRYGGVRLWGSVTFIAANLGGGLLLARLGAADVIWAVVASLGLTAAAAFGLAQREPPAPERIEAASTQDALWRSRAFVAVVLGASLIQASHAVYYGFSTLQWSARGISGPAIGALWALGVVAEVLLFALSGRVVGAVGATRMIMLGGIGGIIRWGAMALDPPTAALPVLQCLHAATFAATHLGAMHFMAQAVPAGRGATAQGDFTAVQGIVSAGAMSLSGVLVAHVGSLAYGAMAMAAGLGTLLAAAAFAWRRGADGNG